MKCVFIPSPLYELLGRPAPGTPIDWAAIDWAAIDSAAIDWDAWRAAAGASKIISYRCGHTGLMPAHITHAAAPAYGIWASSNQDCTPCYLDAKASTAALDGEAQGLPALLGSYKQVRWALTIRRERIEEVKTSRAIRPLAACTERALDKRLAVTEAAWWINCRDVSLTLFAMAKTPRRKTGA